MQNLGWGGSELHTLELTRVLRERGHQVTLVQLGLPVFEQHPAPQALGAPVVRLDFGKPAEKVRLAEWRRRFGELGCEVAVFSKGWVFAGNAALDLAARLTFKRYITIEHITPPKRPPRSTKRYLGFLPGLWWWRKMLFEKGPPVYVRSIGPQRIVGVSHAVTNELHGYAFPRRKLRPIPNGVDGDRYRPDPVQRAATRAAWGIPDDAFVFGTVGRIDFDHKGQDITVALFARLVAANPGRDLRYVLVGDGPHRAAVERQIASLGLGDRVLVTGHTERPWEAHCALDVFLMPSHFEGIGLALLEAMACEVVPIAFGVGGVRDVIFGPKVGWQIPAEDREVMYRAMQAVLDQPSAARATIGRRCRNHILEHYRAAEQYRKIVALIEGGVMSSVPLEAPPRVGRGGERARRVCVLACPKGWGGAELHTVDLVRTLVARGDAVTLVEFGEPYFGSHSELPAEVRLITLQFDVAPEQVGFARWVPILRRIPCDAAVFAKGQVILGSPGLDLAARFCFPRYTVIEHISPPKPPPVKRKRYLGVLPGPGLWRAERIWRIYRRSIGPKRIIGVSRALLRELREYGYPPRKMIAVPNGIDSDLYRPDPVRRETSRDAWGVAVDAFVFGTVGRLMISHKQQDVAIGVFAELRRACPDHDPWYVLVGEGPDRRQLEAIAREAGVAHRVVFAGFSDRPWDMHCGFDVFVLPSRMEGTPLALLETMASGACPIAMDVGGVADVIADPGLGWLVPPGDRDRLFTAMREALLQSPAERAAMARRARAHVEQSFRAQEQFGKVAALVEGPDRS
jgi:glycosyltransferase involved in cell wall biosynthesis